MTAEDFKANARKIANRRGMRGARIFAFGENQETPKLAGIRHGNRELTVEFTCRAEAEMCYPAILATLEDRNTTRRSRP